MRLSRPSLLPVCLCLALPLSLLILAGLAGCGSASSENASSPRTDPFASAASSSTPGTGRVSGTVSAAETVPDTVPSEKAPASSTKKPVNPMDALEVPAWFAKDLASPNVDTRLRALDTWVLTAPVGSIDPLKLAFVNNDDEQVRARAMELIKQDLVRVAEAGE
jgi:hypothetical protein